MTIMKGKVLSIVAFLLLASSLTIANASSTRTPFYLRAIPTSFYIEWTHQADGSHGIMKIIEGGNVEFVPGETAGTWTMDIIEILSIKTGAGIASGHLVINFNFGTTVEGTITAKIQMHIGTNQPPDVDGKFVGHGDMHVKCDLYLIMEGNAAIIVLDGYSW
jgi:hypothetical protein